MYHNRWVIFFWDDKGKQAYHVCPLILRGFWEAYDNNQKQDAPIEVLMGWIHSVPVNLRRKVTVYKGNFLQSKDLRGTKLEGAVKIVNAGIKGTETIFDPYNWIKNVVKDQK